MKNSILLGEKKPKLKYCLRNKPQKSTSTLKLTKEKQYILLHTSKHQQGTPGSYMHKMFPIATKKILFGNDTDGDRTLHMLFKEGLDH